MNNDVPYAVAPEVINCEIRTVSNFVLIWIISLMDGFAFRFDPHAPQLQANGKLGSTSPQRIGLCVRFDRLLRPG